VLLNPKTLFLPALAFIKIKILTNFKLSSEEMKYLRIIYIKLHTGQKD